MKNARSTEVKASALDKRMNHTTGDMFQELLPASPLPSLPHPASRRAEILEALRRGERLTHADAIARGWGWRLSADIFALTHDHGWPIVSMLIPQSGGNPIARYHLPADESHIGGE